MPSTDTARSSPFSSPLPLRARPSRGLGATGPVTTSPITGTASAAATMAAASTGTASGTGTTQQAAKDDALSHFDHALNAALLLAHVALRQGDAVGVLAIGTQGPPRYVAPRKSVAAVNAILERVYDLEPSLAMPDFEQAAREIMARMRRRALVVVLTNLRDEDDETLLPALALLRKRHLVVLASLREAILGRALAARVDSFDRAVTHAAAAEYLAQRERAFGRIGAAGALCFDVEPEMLAISLVNRYLELKRQGQL